MRFLTALFGLALCGGALGAADAPMHAPPRVGVGLTQTRLTLRQPLEMALANNLDIEIERNNVANAAVALRGARGAFDPTFRYTPLFDSRNTPAASVLQGPGGKLTEKYITNNFSLRQRTPFSGASFNVDFENQRASSTNSFASLNPYYTSRLTFGAVVPLLRNRAIDAQRGEIQIRTRQLDISRTDLELRAIDVVARVEQAYWNLAAVRQDVVVQSEGVRLAREQLERNLRMIAAGTLAPIEQAASEAELQRRLDFWFASLGTLTEVENALKLAIAPNRTAAIWGDELVPVDIKAVEPPEASDMKALQEAALSRRLELKQLDMRVDVNAVQRKLAADQTRAQVNLIASYSNAGLGGTIRPGDNPFSALIAAEAAQINKLSALSGIPPLPDFSFGSLPGNLVGGYGAALSNVFAGRYQSVQAGLSIDLNLRNRTAQAGLGQTAIAEKRLKLERSRAEQGIEAQVRNAMQALVTAKQRAAAAAAGLRAAQAKLDSESRLFQNGESTNFLVLTRQNEFLDARRRNVVAALDYNWAISRLEQAVGNTLSWHNITLK